MTYSTHGISPQVETRKAMAMKILTKLQRFRNLSEKNKRKLYLTIVRPQLQYPIIPLNSISKTAHKKLQKVQNKVLIEIYWKHNTKRQNSFNDPTSSKQITHNQHLSTQTCNKYMDPTTGQKPRIIIWQTQAKWKRPSKTFQIFLNFSDNEFTRTPTNI